MIAAHRRCVRAAVQESIIAVRQQFPSASLNMRLRPEEIPGFRFHTAPAVSDSIIGMTTKQHICQLILDQLGEGDMGRLALLVGTRRALAGPPHFKGDLSAAVNSALRTLVASNEVVDIDGTYALPPAVPSVG